MAEVAEVVRGGAADVHLHDARGEGHEGVLPPRARVVQSKRHDGCERGHRARSIKALARGRRPSLLRDTIRSIRRNLYAVPRCARRRGPIDQRKIAAFARRKPWVQIPLGPLQFHTCRGSNLLFLDRLGLGFGSSALPRPRYDRAPVKHDECGRKRALATLAEQNGPSTPCNRRPELCGR